MIDRVYANRHPGRIARVLIRLAAPVVRQMKPNDRWSLGVHAPWWMKVTQERPLSSSPPVKRILMFSAYRGQFSLELPLAAILAWRGHQVTLGYLPKLRSPIKDPLIDHPSAGPYLRDALSRVASASNGRVRVVDLSTFFDDGDAVDEAALTRQVSADSVMYLMRESLDPDRPQDRSAMDYFRSIGHRMQRSAWNFLNADCGSFDIAVVANGTTFESAALCAVIQRIGIPLVCFEKFAFRNIRVLNHGGDFRTFNDLELVWNRREELGYLDPKFREWAASEAMRLMDERRRSSTTTWAWKLQQQPGQRSEDALSEVGIKNGRPFVLICTNVPYDAGYDRLTRVFPSMRSWLVDTVRHLLESTDLQIVVRAHPGEAAHYGGKERSEDNLAAAGLFPGERLIVIPGDQSTNTYGLMENCKFGIVFSSTTGLEMAMMGKIVVVGADVYYGDKGFTQDAADRQSYFAKLDEFARHERILSLDNESILDARMFHFMLHYVMQWPYPWDKGGSTRDLPPHDLVQSDALAQFVPTFDALATTPEEFRANLAGFLAVSEHTHVPRPTKVGILN